tara:strand:+ start:45 stop:293 length:249 start_codon:yes stop_codon:yes gene_type:complete
MDNIYNETNEMELHELEDKLINLQNLIIQYYGIKDDLWRYHPANENFVNPITEHEEVEKRIKDMEKDISEIELKIIHLKSAN